MLNELKEIIAQMNLTNLEYNATIQSGAVLRIYYYQNEVSFSRECMMVHRLTIKNSTDENANDWLNNLNRIYGLVSSIQLRGLFDDRLHDLFKELSTWWKEKEKQEKCQN